MRQSVLNREQQKVLELLKEIDIICRKNKITYFLSPYLTLCAVTERPFPLNPEAGVIYMKTGDMERFKNVFEEEPVLRRALESMDSYTGKDGKKSLSAFPSAPGLCRLFRQKFPIPP